MNNIELNVLLTTTAVLETSTYASCPWLYVLLLTAARMKRRLSQDDRQGLWLLYIHMLHVGCQFGSYFHPGTPAAAWSYESVEIFLRYWDYSVVILFCLKEIKNADFQRRIIYFTFYFKIKICATSIQIKVSDSVHGWPTQVPVGTIIVRNGVKYEHAYMFI